MAETKIEPALSADQWGILKRIHWLSVDDNDVQIDGRELVVIARDYSTAVFRDGIPALIALANAAPPDSDPRKITRERLARLRHFVENETINDPGEDALEFLDALASYLPPEG